MTFESRPFRAARWARGPHAQTLMARMLRSSEGPEYRRERVTTPDGDFVDLDWTPEPAPDAPIVLVMHGLEGSAKRRYMRNVCRELLGRGLHPVSLNFRGCSGEPNHLPRFYHSGETGDPAFVIELLRERHPGRPVLAMGFSLGGNVLLKMLGEREDGGAGLVDGAVAMSVPYNLAAGCRLLEKSAMGSFYTTYFMRMLKEKVRLKRGLLEPHLDLDAVLAAKTIWDFDELATAPLNGFDSAAHYYQECSSVRFLAGVKVPTLLLHAVDDPFLPPASIPRAEVAANPFVTMALHDRGGHVGFLEGTPWRPRFWGDEETARFLFDACG